MSGKPDIAFSGGDGRRGEGEGGGGSNGVRPLEVGAVGQVSGTKEVTVVVEHSNPHKNMIPLV